MADASRIADRVAAHYDGHSADALARFLDVPRVVVEETVPSTMDVAHVLAGTGAPAGTLVLADAQSAGRGRGGRSWQSEPGAGIWLTLVERPNDAAGIGVLSLRIGLRVAGVLERYVEGRIALKWPNDVYLASGKLAGILVEARWRESARPDWVAIGLGVNVLPPAGMQAAGLAPGVRRVDVLGELLPALRAAASARGELTPDELRAFASRDLARGRGCREPARGVVEGLTPDGALQVRTSTGIRAFYAGSLVLEEAP